jgi:hypothetical protein
LSGDKLHPEAVLSATALRIVADEQELRVRIPANHPPIRMEIAVGAIGRAAGCWAATAAAGDGRTGFITLLFGG